LNTKIKRREREGIVFDDVVEEINLTKEDKKFLESKQQ
jgi:hypothetical protein